MSFPNTPHFLGVCEELGLLELFLARNALRQAASSSGESHPGSTWSIRANKAAIPSSVVGQSSSRMPKAGPAPSIGSTSTRVPSGSAAGASRIICPFLIVP